MTEILRKEVSRNLLSSQRITVDVKLSVSIEWLQDVRAKDNAKWSLRCCGLSQMVNSEAKALLLQQYL